MPNNDKIATENIRKSTKKSWKFWAAFWLISAVLLFGWYVFLQIQNKNIQNLKSLAGVLPIGSERKNELQVLADIYDKMGGFPPVGRQATGEKTFSRFFFKMTWSFARAADSSALLGS